MGSTTSIRGRHLEPLTYSEYKVDEIGPSLQGQTYKLADCSVEQYWESHQSADLLHLATYAVVDSTDSDLSFIGMANGQPIYSFEIANHTSAPHLVTLSACESSRGKSIPGEAELSLARSYFQAGSQAVVASLWPVNDQSTAQIMVNIICKYLYINE